MESITLEGVTKQYPGGVTAVDDVSLVVEDGEFLTLVGPSGCGKTTTLRTIAGFEQPTSGRIGIDKQSVNGVPPDKRETGMVFQDFALFPHMTVAENIAYGLRTRNQDEETIEKRVQEMLELVELPETADRKPANLSGGQQQRIALARAVAPEPSVLLLDEPLASLDKQLRETMQIELQRIQQRLGITTVLVTHNQKEALTMSDRIVVMNDGQFEQVGTPKEVYMEPTSPFVAEFVGTANLFEGTITDIEDGVATIESDGMRLTSTKAADRDRGDAVTAVLRPEHITVGDRMVATDGAGGPETVLDGTVAVTQYTGDQIEYHVELDTGKEITAVERVGTTEATTGDAVQMRLPASSCLLLDHQ